VIINNICENVSRERRVEEYLVLWFRVLEKEREVDKNTGAFSPRNPFCVSINQSLLCSVRSFSGHILHSFWARSFGLKFSLCVAHLYKYLLSALKTSRTNTTPFFDFSECSKTIDEKRVIRESIHYERYYCGEFIPPRNTTLELLERVSSLGKNKRKCYHHRIP
jgi:hypothetical protein